MTKESVTVPLHKEGNDKTAGCRRTWTRSGAVFFVITVTSAIALGIWQHVQVTYEISALEAKYLELERKLSARESDSDIQVDDISSYTRSKRAARTGRQNSEAVTTAAPPPEAQVTGSSTMNRRVRSNRKAKGAHYEAFVDRDLLVRQEAHGLPTVGQFTSNGFRPNDTVYRIWKATNWTDERQFRYNEADGKVTVKKSGYYILYGQILFHGPSARKSFGIHVNDNLVPFVEAISFDILDPTRRKRSLPTMYNEESILTSATNFTKGRPARSVSSYASYNQCNTFAVRYLNKNDKVFIKSLESGRTLILQRSLTFWGLARLQ